MPSGDTCDVVPGPDIWSPDEFSGGGRFLPILLAAWLAGGRPATPRRSSSRPFCSSVSTTGPAGALHAGAGSPASISAAQPMGGAPRSSRCSAADSASVNALNMP